jgi:hypothetical protein
MHTYANHWVKFSVKEESKVLLMQPLSAYIGGDPTDHPEELKKVVYQKKQGLGYVDGYISKNSLLKSCLQ